VSFLFLPFDREAAAISEFAIANRKAQEKENDFYAP
jgi:hypothetical protein